MAVIELVSKDKIKPFTIVDDEDYEWLSEYRWRWQAGYAVATIDKRDVKMHRLIMQPTPEQVVDHKNGQRHDNRRANLRLATFTENARNHRKASYANMSSNFVGVSRKGYDDSRTVTWKATIQGHSLGNYQTEEEAAYIRDQAAMQLYGEFAYTNFNYEPI